MPFSLWDIGACNCVATPPHIACGVCGGIHLVSGTITDANGTWPFVYNSLSLWWQAVPTVTYPVSGWTGFLDANNCCIVDPSFPQNYGYTLQCLTTPSQLGLTAYTWANACNASFPCTTNYLGTLNIPFTGYPGGPWHATDLPPVATIATVRATPVCTGGTSLTASFSWTWGANVLPAPATSATVSFVITTP